MNSGANATIIPVGQVGKHHLAALILPPFRGSSALCVVGLASGAMPLISGDSLMESAMSRRFLSLVPGSLSIVHVELGGGAVVIHVAPRSTHPCVAQNAVAASQRPVRAHACGSALARPQAFCCGFGCE